jgi:hypothetical protein
VTSLGILREIVKEIKISAIPLKKSQLPGNIERIFARQLAILE